MTVWDSLANLLRVRRDQVEDVLQSEASARRALMLSRRGFFVGAGAVAAGTLLIELGRPWSGAYIMLIGLDGREVNYTGYERAQLDEGQPIQNIHFPLCRGFQSALIAGVRVVRPGIPLPDFMFARQLFISLGAQPILTRLELQETIE
ncbi:MAG TPA: hypothetical protein VG734_26075 [Lacunisphaera sp.]|nr:hypothetical protein [Lacunisphaera sp.]